ncbi:MAG: Fe-S cluster assembly sulfur transfer protein SufU [Burkholderiales bacterium]
MSAVRKLYDDVVMDHIKNARNYRVLPGATRSAEGVNPLCGDSFQVYVRIEGESISEVSFQCECCGISMASASIMTQAIKGKSVANARRAIRDFSSMIAGQRAAQPESESADALAILGVVRDFPSRLNCAWLAWVTLEAALDGRPQAVLGA